MGIAMLGPGGPAQACNPVTQHRSSPLRPPPTGKAAWIAGTTFLVLFVPFIIEMDREAQLMEIENQQLGALTGPAPAAK